MPNQLSDQHKLLVVLALAALYFIWGSTFLAMRFAMESLPPFLMGAIRFLAAGGLLYGWLRWRGAPAPARKQWLGAAIVGTLLLAVGNGGVAYAEQTVSSGIAALAIATVPLWTAIFASFWNERPHVREWLGVIVGTAGIIVLNLGDNLQASPLGAVILLLAAASWAFGSLWGKHLSMPVGAMASATQMIAGGVVLLLASMLGGETWPVEISTKSVLAILYLILFGSFVAYSAYLFLLKHVRPALATSYAFVNPVVAMFLGAVLADESIGGPEYVALIIILVGVLLVLPWKRSQE
ncbi:MAG TPA: drug/metabolite exporter YedA [Methylophilaceae bacterium]|nr:drug/metabolite exporter YedA [Methylophilaceae bacterium]